MTILAMTIMPFYHQMVTINRYFNNFNKFQQQKIWAEWNNSDPLQVGGLGGTLDNLALDGTLSWDVGSH
jgi:hypothetical protein